MKNHLRLVANGRCEFELAEKPPRGYEIWNIGRNMAEGYVPFCRLSAQQPFDGARQIESNALKAIKCDGSDKIMAAIGYGPQTAAQMREYVQAHPKNHESAYMRTAIPFLEAIGY